MKDSWVYILECSDGSFYTGLTTDIDARLWQHHSGFYDGYTASRRPVKLVWCEDFDDIDQAIDIERQIKGWTRAKKKALIAGEFQLLHELAKSTEKRSRRSKRT
ncbi:MAG: GIY-YIG nuclease family protein [Bacteroidota bacterium]